jgi:hypothetical protein
MGGGRVRNKYKQLGEEENIIYRGEGDGNIFSQNVFCLLTYYNLNVHGMSTSMLGPALLSTAKCLPDRT